MDEWDRDFINLVEAGFIKFENYLRGELLFGCVGADLDCRIVNQEKNPKIEFTFQGEDEGDPVCGRGWAQFNGKRLQGKVFFHLGDESGFFAIAKKTVH